jgi:hypothetical protein
VDASFILSSFFCVYKKERINGKSTVLFPHQQSVIVILKTNMDTGSCSIRSSRFDEPKRIVQGCGNSISLVPNSKSPITGSRVLFVSIGNIIFEAYKGN